MAMKRKFAALSAAALASVVTVAAYAVTQPVTVPRRDVAVLGMDSVGRAPVAACDQDHDLLRVTGNEAAGRAGIRAGDGGLGGGRLPVLPWPSRLTICLCQRRR